MRLGFKHRILTFGNRATRFIHVDPLYKDIDEMPAASWYKILETGDKSHLKIDTIYSVRDQDVEDRWMKLQDQYYDEFGTTPELQEFLYKAHRLKDLLCEFIMTGNRQLLSEINMLEMDLEPPEEGDEPKVNFYSTVDKVEVIRKLQLDLDKISVKRWYSILRNLRSHASKAANNQGLD